MAGVGSLYGFDEERLYCEDRETIKTLGCEASPCTPTDRIVIIARTPNAITADLFPARYTAALDAAATPGRLVYTPP